MTGEIVFQPETVSLYRPVKGDDGKDILSLTIDLISHDQHSEIMGKNLSEPESFKALVMLSCGLSDAEAGQIKGPDFNTLKLRLSDIVAKGSDLHFKKMGIDFDPDCPFLLQSITGDDGKVIDRVDIDLPSVDTIILMSKFGTAEERTLFINKKCTGLSQGELGRMSITDWNYTQSRLNDFLNETADFFQSGTSIPSQTSSP